MRRSMIVGLVTLFIAPCLLLSSAKAEVVLPAPGGLSPEGTREQPFQSANLTPELRWASVANATGYILTIENIENYPPDKVRGVAPRKPTELFFQVSSGRDVPPALFSGTRYKWTVRAVYEGTLGLPNSGYLRTPGPAIPEPIGPGVPALDWQENFDAGSGQRIETLTPALEWHEVPGADNYSIVIRDWTTNTLLTRDSGDFVGDRPYFQVETGRFQLGHTYRWSVTAWNSSGIVVPGATSAGLYSQQSEVLVFTVGNWKDSPLAFWIPGIGLGIVVIGAVLTIVATFWPGTPIFGPRFTGKERDILLQYDALFVGSVLTFFTLLTAFDAESDKPIWGAILFWGFLLFLVAGVVMAGWAAVYSWRRRAPKLAKQVRPRR